MNKVPVSQLGLKCSKCKEITQTIEPMKIKKIWEKQISYDWSLFYMSKQKAIEGFAEYQKLRRKHPYFPPICNFNETIRSVNSM